MSDEKNSETTNKPAKAEKFVEGIDYYFADNLMILTAHFLFKRGYCCGNNCRHCPYPKPEETDL
ncbi:MAG: DUF5522 domain-containing protein [Acidobacteriota bacterium]|nr:DUF5522 domain-containing protein [Acidobacteriota bacterium]